MISYRTCFCYGPQLARNIYIIETIVIRIRASRIDIYTFEQVFCLVQKTLPIYMPANFEFMP